MLPHYSCSRLWLFAFGAQLVLRTVLLWSNVRWKKGPADLFPLQPNSGSYSSILRKWQFRLFVQQSVPLHGCCFNF